MTLLDHELDKVVVYLDPHEFQSTWLGNKVRAVWPLCSCVWHGWAAQCAHQRLTAAQAIYRTRMAIKDNGTLMIMGPNVRKFGEDEEVDKLIRK